ncbi:HAMP domain-containing sensor histidine kinase [Microbulbifer sp. GL-2]|uniref:sensor histidine kinase n=1 Tax=Microbulbifer sp. GL-2 TaxID=2591606 RepID=UPI0011645D61|nr:HAMP domain-containing sensor histidine kinase [Microbulbifer sp. GL-2]BBM00108.1 hypothetical protein GL2_01820 [Microbulbifer sp. GL-2]
MLSKVEGIVNDSIIEINDQEFFHPELYPKFKKIEPKHFIYNNSSPSKFTIDYITHFKILLAKQGLSKQEDLAARGRLFALGEDISPPLEKIPSILVWYLLNSEFPEDFHEYIDNLTNERFEDWPEYAENINENATSLAKYYIEAEYFLDTEDLCVQLLDTKGNSILSNIDGYNPGNLQLRSAYTVISNIAPALGDNHKPYVCLMQAAQLSDGGTLLLGKNFTREYQLLETQNRIIFYGFLITIIISLSCGYLVSRRAVKRISDINQVCSQIIAGDLNKRISLNNNGDDYDQLALNINAMLDKIQQLMTGVKQVSDNIAHDLKSPLTRLRGQLELLLHMEKPGKETFEAIIEENDQIIECFNALLRISQVEQGARISAFRYFSLHRVIDTLVEVYEPIFQDQGIDLSISLLDDQYVIYGDKEQWLQSIANLFDNVIKYAPKSGNLRVKLSARSEGDRSYLQLQLHDSGPGIPKDDQKKVFERFYRLESHRRTKGNGLGLSLVIAVCNLHKAKISLQNCNGLLVKIDIPSTTRSPSHTFPGSEKMEISV